VSQSLALQTELRQRQRNASIVVIAFLILDLGFTIAAYLIAREIPRPTDRTVIMGLWIAVLMFGLGALVLRRTRFNATRLKDIAAVQGPSALLRTLQSTTIQIACLGGAIALMGFVIMIRTGDWLDMLRAAGVALIVLIYAYPFRNAWQRAVTMLAPDAA
jgi:divalent metal cation (Fe/Co/Zn/Cd) transporter